MRAIILGILVVSTLALPGCIPDPDPPGDDDDTVQVDDDDTSVDDDDAVDDDDDATADDDDSSSQDDDDSGDDDDSAPAAPGAAHDSGDDDDSSTLPMDGDGDGYDASVDCDDDDLSVFPGAPEICDGADNDCGGAIDEDCTECSLVIPLDHPDVQTGIDVAGATGEPDPVCVLPGTYAEILDFHGYDVHVLGLAGPFETVVDATGMPGTVAHFSPGGNATLEGFTLTGGTGHGAPGYSQGGGVFVDQSQAELYHLVITGNTSGGQGGGIDVVDAPAVVLEDVLIHGNEATSHGGGMRIHDSLATLARVRVTDNVAGSWGGGIASWGTSESWLAYVILAGNQAGTNGGGLAVNGEVHLEGGVIVGNVAADDGGGVYTEDCVAGLFITNTIVAENSAAAGGGFRNGVYTCNVTQTFTDVYGNSPDDYGDFPVLTGNNGNVAIPHGLADLTAPLAVDWDLHLQAGSLLEDIGDLALLDAGGGPSDIGAYGGLLGGAWDLDMDGAFEWWQPGPCPGPPWDCQDRDPTVP